MALRECLSVLLLLGCPLSAEAAADVYVHTADDGSVSLTNVPADRRFQLLVPGAAMGGSNVAPAVPASRPAPAKKAGFDRLVDDVSRRYGVDSALLHAVISVESAYDPRARSGKGAAGLMQLMPATAKRYGVSDALDPAQNVAGGARYLRDLLRMFDNDLTLALAAYNAGENAVERHGRRVPPYRETVRYVPRVLEAYERYRAGH